MFWGWISNDLNYVYCCVGDCGREFVCCSSMSSVIDMMVGLICGSFIYGFRNLYSGSVYMMVMMDCLLCC